ncbi:MAG: family 1 glycosylhydrolase [bacterium]
MATIYRFPDHFLWGAATAAYQIEGGILKSDWSEKYPAGLACDHYNRYEEDFSLLQELNLNTYRMSVEWSRLEAENGLFNQKEFDYYRAMLRSLKSKGITVMVTLHHFTSPGWVAKTGGFSNPKTVDYFVRFAEKVFHELGEMVDLWVTINEPTLYSYLVNPLLNGWQKESLKGISLGEYPKAAKTIITSFKVMGNLIRAHNGSYKMIKNLSSGKAQVGLAHNIFYFEPSRRNNFFDRLLTNLQHYLWNIYFLDQIKNNLDFIGVNYYFHHIVRHLFRSEDRGKVKTEMGWDIYPEGIYHVIMGLKKYHLPVYITENGIADSKDLMRRDFIRDHLLWIHRAITSGADVRGYCHWSLLDNFEWAHGTKMRFGLVAMDYGTQKRTIRPSARYYADIAKNNYLET